ncbi:MMPL family transporter [Nocardia amamiensis]|uniref:MMPL family transporter n=1 Tax=Nocardia amamiensis TaxID=404578 RepID=UPI00082AA243|nr:MMPL family transporter [Nocardia amamiensis]
MSLSTFDATGALGRLAQIPTGRRSKWVVVIAWIIALVAIGGLASELKGAQTNDAVEWLPGSAESTRAFEASQKFLDADESSAVLVYERPSGITPADVSAAEADVAALGKSEHVIAEKVVGPVPSKDGQALQVLLPIHTAGGAWPDIAKIVDELKEQLPPRTDGLAFHITGPVGYAAGYGWAFGAIDGVLVLAAAAVVIVVLLISYGPVLWLLPLIAAIFGLVVAQGAVYLATKADVTVTAMGASALMVLVFGAGTDYALLLVARYREELRRHEDRHEAMAIALQRAAPAIMASAATVVVGMLAFLAADMNSTKGLGPVCAIGVVVSFAVMITLLPALLVIAGRGVFWPRHPAVGSIEPSETGIWKRIGNAVATRPRAVWIGTVAVLLVAAAGVIGFTADGIATRDSFVGDADAVAGEEILGRHFDIGAGNPFFIVGSADHVAAVQSALTSVDRIGPVKSPVVKDGQFYIEGTLADPPDSKAAEDTVDRTRAAVHAIDGAEAKVGGNTAVTLDTERAQVRDNKVIVPLVLVMIMLILMLLLRAVLAPVLLMATVVLSFFAALGLSRWLFELFGFNGADPSLPLLGFVFLVALGVDYNIFLMSRVREEASHHGTRRAALIALASTGNVITSAGLVLAGTFAVLATLSIVFMAEIGVLVAVGLLLDALIVRSILVTALNLDIGPTIWWPSALAQRPEKSPLAEEEPPRELARTD